MLNQDDLHCAVRSIVFTVALFFAARASCGEDRRVDLQFWRDVAESNAASWSSIFSVDIEYQTSVRAVENGRVLFERAASGHRWIKQADRQRLLLRDLDGRGRMVDRLIRGDRQYRLEYPLSLDLSEQPLRLCDDRPVNAAILPAPPGLIDELVPQNLERLYFIHTAPPMTLRELLAGRVPQMATSDSEVQNERLTFRIDLSDGEDADGGSFVVLTVDAGKGFLIQKAEIVEAAAAHSAVDGAPIPIRTVWEVHEWAQPDEGVWYPREVTFVNHGRADAPPSEDGYFIRWTLTRLSVNQPLPDKEWLGFSFPENAVVQEDAPASGAGRILVWGPANLPQAEFESEAEYEVFRRAICNDSATARKGDAAAEPGGPREAPVVNWRAIVVVNAVLLALFALWRQLRRRQHSQ